MEKTGTNAATASCVADATQVSHRSLADLEKVIHEGELAYVEVGKALQEIQKGKLYKDKYSTFEEYCEKRWGFSRQTAYEYMNAAAVAANVSSNLHNRPSKTQALVLSALDPDQQKEVEADTDFADTTVKELKEKIAKVRGVATGGGSSGGSGGGEDPPEKTLEQWLDEQVREIALQRYGHYAAKFEKYPWQHPTEIANVEGSKLDIYREIGAICAKKLQEAK
jgi:hypothetical protein